MTGEAPPKIRIRGLSKAFGPKVVLDRLDLDVPAGSSIVVIGGSGSGKSVLIKCILGLIEPDAGTIEIDLKNGDRVRVEGAPDAGLVTRILTTLRRA